MTNSGLPRSCSSAVPVVSLGHHRGGPSGAQFMRSPPGPADTFPRSPHRGEVAEGKPVRKRPDQLSRPAHFDLALTERVGKRLMAEPDTVHRLCVGADGEVDVKPRWVPADGRLFRLQ
jgi:hypothetical protein